jgi:peptidoglycan hydrolase-like protein with peptidoglycan-binding domain
MSEYEEVLKPLVGSVTPKSFEPLVEQAPKVEAVAEPTQAKEELKQYGKAPQLKTEGDKIISFSALKMDAYEGNSESVKVVQLRLNELGYSSVINDKFGRLGQGAVEAINEFKKSKGLEENGSFDKETLAYLFDGASVGVRE